MQNLKRNMSGNKKSFLRDLVINSERCYNLMAFNSVNTFRALMNDDEDCCKSYEVGKLKFTLL